MREVMMIRRTVRKIGRQLESLIERDVPLNRAFDILSGKSKTIEEIVVVEVMREVYLESVVGGEMNMPVYADSKTRSARMPEIALSR